MPRCSKAVIVGLLAGLTGLILILLAHGLEENIGLDLLFKLRGIRQAPSEVMIVAIDKSSSRNLNLPAKPEKWPRWLHAHLIEKLAKNGATVIAFDVIFDEAHSPEYDNLFATAVGNAGNVILSERLKKQTITLTDKRGSYKGDLNIEKLVPPIPPLAESAAALAPFPLPKMPHRISQYWAFKKGAGDTATLPVVAFQIFALDVYGEFLQLMENLRPSLAEALPRNKDEIIRTKGTARFIQTMRAIFKKNPLLAEEMLKELESSTMLSHDTKKRKLLRSFINMYNCTDSCYLNFYGAPGTINTLSYYQVLQPRGGASASLNQSDLKGKVVFVGLSELLEPEQHDGYYTVFTQSSGVDLSGVEIAATAFANLLEDMPVQHISLPSHLLIILFWGVILGIFCCLFPPLIAAVGIISTGLFYFLFAKYQFVSSAMWYPLVVPLFFQAPLAFFGTVLWKQFETNKERQNIRKAFGYYLPNNVVDELSKNTGDIKKDGQIVHGTCLWTDAQSYTTLSEKMKPEEFNNFMNRYYEAIFEPVKRYGGIVSNIIGDSMLAIWATSHPDAFLRSQACLAALDIDRAVQRFNESSENLKLPTRIGLHSGHLLLGNVGAIDHYEYRPVGDIVITSTRLEGLNKYLGTSILVSEEVMHHLHGFLTRKVGDFLLVGKTKPIVANELICRMEDSSEKLRELCNVFTEALSAYRNRAWEEAIEMFTESMALNWKDGPSLFYLKLCEKYRKEPPDEAWSGIVCLERK